MKQFTDNPNPSAAGEQRQPLAWTIDLNFGTLLRLKGVTHDLLDPAKQVDHPLRPMPLCEFLWHSDLDFFELLWHLVEPQAEARGITCQEFAERLSPEALSAAQNAFFEEWLDFFIGRQKLAEAEALAHVLKTIRELTAAAKAEIQRKKEELAPKEAEIVRLSLQKACGQWEESLDRTLADLHTASSPLPT